MRAFFSKCFYCGALMRIEQSKENKKIQCDNCKGEFMLYKIVKCHFCGTENLKGNKCRNCGADPVNSKIDKETNKNKSAEQKNVLQEKSHEVKTLSVIIVNNKIAINFFIFLLYVY